MENETKEQETILIRLLRVVYLYRKPLLIFNVSIFILSVIISILLPQWYRGSITFIVNDKDTGSFLSAFADNIPLDILGGNQSKVAQYMNFITSRRILDELDSLYNLQAVYEEEYRKHFYKTLKSNINVIDNDDNTITVEFFYEEDPIKAANIANSIYESLYNLSLELNRDKNREFKRFMENSYKKTLERLKNAEKKFTEFQVQNKIFDVEVQFEALIKQITELEIQKMKFEIELKYLEKSMSKADQQVQALKLKVQVLADKINELKYGAHGSDFSLNTIPDKAVKYFNLYRDVEILNKVLEFLVPQLENARIQEGKTAADIQLLDKAVPEDYKAKPKRIAIIFTAVFLSIIISVLIALIYENYIVRDNFLKKITD